MCKQHSIREPLDMVQYKWYLIPKFKDGKGICIFKAHHSFGDGLGVASYFAALSQIFDPKALPAMKPIPFPKQLLIWCLSPFLVLKSSFDILLKMRVTNSINTDQPMSG